MNNGQRASRMSSYNEKPCIVIKVH